MFYISFKGEERPAKTKLMPAKLRAVLVNFVFLKIFRKIIIWILDFLEMELFESKTKLVDSAQC